MARAADVLVETMGLHGIDRVFCVPGESYLAVIDAMYDAPHIDVVTTRHESGATLMGVADGKMTGRAGVAMVSRGPGATNASIGVHVAEQDAVPLVLFIGQVARADLGRMAFQEVDYRRFFGGMAKHVVEVTDAEALPGEAAKAFAAAEGGTPGPVVVSLPEDMLLDDISAPPAARADSDLPVPDDRQIAEIAERLAVAERPLLIAGGQIDQGGGRDALRAVSEAWQVPVAAGWRHQDLFDNTHPNYAAHMAFNMPAEFERTLNEADLVMAVGSRLGDVTTQGYAIPKAPKPDQPLIHVHPDAAQLGRVYETDLEINADGTAVLAALAKMNAKPAPDGRSAWIARAHDLAASRMVWDFPRADDGVVFGNVIKGLAGALDDDAVIANDAGNFSTWLHRLFPFKPTHTFLGAVAGAMGFGVPAAVAAGLRHPDRQVACLVGDGGFQMTGNEMSVAVERNLPIRIFVSNNGSLGTIRLYQEKDYPGRTIATDLPNPDFAAVGAAFGLTAFKIETEDDVAPVIEKAMAVDGPALVEVATSLEYLAAYSRMSALKAAAEA